MSFSERDARLSQAPRADSFTGTRRVTRSTTRSSSGSIRYHRLPLMPLRTFPVGPISGRRRQFRRIDVLSSTRFGNELGVGSAREMPAFFSRAVRARWPAVAALQVGQPDPASVRFLIVAFHWWPSAQTQATLWSPARVKSSGVSGAFALVVPLCCHVWAQISKRLSQRRGREACNHLSVGDFGPRGPSPGVGREPPFGYKFASTAIKSLKTTILSSLARKMTIGPSTLGKRSSRTLTREIPSPPKNSDLRLSAAAF